MEIKRVLIANRGEIARRIIRTCKKMGLATIAVYSVADQDLPFVQEADFAVPIGEAQVYKSYLNMERILEVAKEYQADAIHPGYGLLSENATFALRCEQEDIRLIGPNSSVIEKMGDKITARKMMEDAGVPVVPGFHGKLVDVNHAMVIGNEIGYPVMLKASAGGGGIGMQICYQDSDLVKAFPSAQGRAKAYFGNDQMFLEKYIENPHHIEVQILGDSHGKIIHLFERECSIQRRHQKVIEEAPSPWLPTHLRELICQSAIKAARAVSYTGAGTVEFIVDQEGNYYFLEMNTRLQVEHPVTEVTTGIDLVEWQIRISRGEMIPWEQQDIQMKGHGIEFRIYAEDPVTFFPSPGKVSVYKAPHGEHIRVDDGIVEGNQITPFYDPMIAKIIIWGESRQEAIKRACQALQKTFIEGVKSNIPLHLRILEMQNFQKGIYTTNFMKEIEMK